jgi:hypothetical protein
MEIRFDVFLRHFVARTLNQVCFDVPLQVSADVSLSRYCLQMGAPNSEINGENEALLRIIRCAPPATQADAP